MQTETLYTKEQAAVYLGVSTQTLSRLVSQKELNAVRVGKFIKFKPDDITAYLNRQSTLQPA